MTSLADEEQISFAEKIAGLRENGVYPHGFGRTMSRISKFFDQDEIARFFTHDDIEALAAAAGKDEEAWSDFLLAFDSIPLPALASNGTAENPFVKAIREFFHKNRLDLVEATFRAFLITTEETRHSPLLREMWRITDEKIQADSQSSLHELASSGSVSPDRIRERFGSFLTRLREQSVLFLTLSEIDPDRAIESVRHWLPAAALSLETSQSEETRIRASAIKWPSEAKSAWRVLSCLTGPKNCFKPRPPDVILTINKDLSSARYQLRDDSQEEPALKRNLTILHPSLLWPSSFDLPPSFRSRDWRFEACAVLQGETAEQFARLIPAVRQGDFEYRFDGVTLHWIRGFSFPPNIGSFFLARCLRDHGFLKRSISTIADVGAGSGFAGLYLAKHNLSVKKILFTELGARAAILQKHNTALNTDRETQDRQIDFEFRADPGLSALKTESFELMVLSSPPYIPERPDQKCLTFRGADALIGTDLLEQVVVGAGRHARELVIDVSRLAWPELERSAKAAGATVEILDTMWTPLKIGPLAPRSPEDLGISQDNSKYTAAIREFESRQSHLDWLVCERGLSERHEANFRYWHEIVACCVQYP